VEEVNVVEEKVEEADDEAGEDVVVRENGVEYVLPAAALRKGQKTGFYADQSANRLALRRLLERRPGATVLDAYCYSGGFAISAALGGAAAVNAVDSSSPSLAMARVNADRNGVGAKITLEQADVPAYLSAAAGRGEKWDIVVLDPPKLAPSAKAVNLERATSKYRQINAAALKVVAPGGLLLTCSCSQAMTKDRDVFLNMVRRSAAFVGREVTLLQVSGAAADHPTDLSEGANAGYLTACLFAVR
jgi:23S rRNA G2069 N7-methylase RlmK/C1962 C5-methylase RlmI